MQIVNGRILVLLCLLLGSTASCARSTPSPQQALQQLFADEWDTRMRDEPLFATASGVNDYNDRLPAVSPDDFDRRERQDRDYQRRLAAIDRNSLDAAGQLNYALFAFVLQHRVALAPFRSWRIPILSDDGFHFEVARMAEGVSMRSERDYRDYIARLHAVPDYFAQNIVNMRAGIRDGFTLPSAILPGIVAVIDAQQITEPERSAFYKPFLRMAHSVAPEQQRRLRTAAREAIVADVAPAYGELARFMHEEYVPAARIDIAASALPDGSAYYAAQVRYFTNLDVTPEQVHTIGLAEVARIHAEMQTIIDELGFKGDFADFLKYLRADPQFYAKTPDELLKDAAYIAKQIDGMLPAWFGLLPRQPYSVQPVPADIAPNYTGGRYVPAPIGGNRGGEYWVNTYALEKRPLYVLAALTLHEAVPGHHLQGALAQELVDVPAFRRTLYPHAFGEGWGLYAEKLGKEMGLYHTPYEHFGRLTYEMWRACRLVVDTGMHAKGWTRQQALDYMAGNTALSLHEVRTEVDRYIAWPGQALAYKMGELKILELRERARRELGDNFDIRAFHDAVLGNGGVPLPVLEQQIDAYIARSR